jgi:hypothetical protein
MPNELWLRINPPMAYKGALIAHWQIICAIFIRIAGRPSRSSSGAMARTLLSVSANCPCDSSLMVSTHSLRFFQSATADPGSAGPAAAGVFAENCRASLKLTAVGLLLLTRPRLHRRGFTSGSGPEERGFRNKAALLP